jgi:hypothetical protein
MPEKCEMARAEAVQCLVEILKTPIGEVTSDHRLAQSYDAKSGRIELRNKLGAMQLLAKMCEWNDPRSTSSSMDTRRSKTWLKSSFDCADRERHAVIRVLNKLARSGRTWIQRSIRPCPGSLLEFRRDVRRKHEDCHPGSWQALPRSGVSLSLAAEPSDRVGTLN